jgi:hypothetical protein
VRASSSAVIAWNGKSHAIASATSVTRQMLATVRITARRTSAAEPVARPIATSTSGRISGAISIAPITTAVLSSARPSVASIVEIVSCSQYPVASPSGGRSIARTSATRWSGARPSDLRMRSWTRRAGPGNFTSRLYSRGRRDVEPRVSACAHPLLVGYRREHRPEIVGVPRDPWYR